MISEPLLADSALLHPGGSTLQGRRPSPDAGPDAVDLDDHLPVGFAVPTVDRLDPALHLRLAISNDVEATFHGNRPIIHRRAVLEVSVELLDRDRARCLVCHRLCSLSRISRPVFRDRRPPPSNQTVVDLGVSRPRRHGEERRSATGRPARRKPRGRRAAGRPRDELVAGLANGGASFDRVVRCGSKWSARWRGYRPRHDDPASRSESVEVVGGFRVQPRRSRRRRSTNALLRGSNRNVRRRPATARRQHGRSGIDGR